MAFNSNYHTEFNSNWNSYYPGSDSDDQMKPRTLVTAADDFQPEFIRSSSGNSLFENTNEMQSNFHADEAQITYSKDPETNFELDFEFNPEDMNDMDYEDLGFGFDKVQLKENDDMEIEESDYQSTALGDNESLFSESQIFETYAPSTEASSHNAAMSFKRNFMRMRELVDRILQGRQITDSDLIGLSDYERNILNFINQKKSKSEGSKNARRREEKQKLFFKSALKFIEGRFMASISKANKKKVTDNSIFYRTYFQDVADIRGLDIAAFYPPSQRRRIPGGRDVKSELKTFNLKYIELILSSKRFFEETFEFLENGFVQNYSKSRYKKIDRILEHAIEVFDQTYSQFANNSSQNASAFMEIVNMRLQELILNNPKSKLPWSNAELNETKEFARQTIYKIYQKSNGSC